MCLLLLGVAPDLGSRQVRSIFFSNVTLTYTAPVSNADACTAADTAVGDGGGGGGGCTHPGTGVPAGY